MNNYRYSRLLLATVLGFTVSCSDSTQFVSTKRSSTQPTTPTSTPSSVPTGSDGDPGNTPVANAADAEAPTDNTVPPVPVATQKPICNPGEVGLTKVTLLSTGIKINTTNQTLRYELSVISCADGSIIPVKNQAVGFDLNALSVNGFQDIKYTVSDSSSNGSVATGKLKTIQGSDLFKHTGSSFAHWETDTLSYTTAAAKLVLEISLNDNSFKPNDEGATTIPSHIQISGAQAVTQDLDITNL